MKTNIKRKKKTSLIDEEGTSSSPHDYCDVRNPSKSPKKHERNEPPLN